MIKLNRSVGTFPAGSDVTFSPQVEVDLVASGKASYITPSGTTQPAAPQPAQPIPQPAPVIAPSVERDDKLSPKED